MRSPWFPATVALALVLACTSDNLTEPTVPSLVIVSGGGENQSGAVGTTLPLALIVQVTGVSGSPNDQVLNFVVTSGGGSVFANVVLTSTPSSGPAAKVSGIGQDKWTLGPAAGPQTVEARLVDPKTGATLTLAVFHATALPGSANLLKLSAGDKQSAPVGTSVGVAPAVLVTDQAGNPIPNVAITFQVASGGGGIGGPAPVTNANGVATVGGWILGVTAGPNTLTASRAGLAGSPLTFTATGIVGAATSLAAVAGDGQHAPRSSAVPVAPEVAVRDAYGNGVAGVAVTFTVTAGGGTMDGISSVTTLTGPTGRASVGWSLGPAAGANALRATALGLAGSPLTFGATGYTPLYVTNIDAEPRVTVFEGETNGNSAPVRTISGPHTGLNTPTMVVHDAAGQLYVSNYLAQSITVYAAGASGDAAPIRTIIGNATRIDRPYGLTLDAAGNIYVTNVTSRSVSVYAANATGNASPLRTIIGGNTGLIAPTGVRVDHGGQLYVGNNDGNSITVYAPGADGDAAPVRTIKGPSTGLSIPSSVEMDGAGQLYVSNAGNHSVTIFAAGADGDAAPVRTIAGQSTGMSHPVGLARDDAGLIYVANYFNSTITIFAADASGDVAPVRTIRGGSTALSGPNWLAF